MIERFSLGWFLIYFGIPFCIGHIMARLFSKRQKTFGYRGLRDDKNKRDKKEQR